MTRVGEKHYLFVVAPGVLTILRVPWPMPRWREIVRATTAVRHSHGLRLKDVYSLDGLVGLPGHRSAEDLALVARVEDAYRGAEDRLPRFWLYDWSRGGFKLARAATTEEVHR